MEQLNFYPVLKDDIQEGTTIRLGDRVEYDPDDYVDITVGWTKEEAKFINEAKIKAVAIGRLDQIVTVDIPWYVLLLSLIYRKTVRPSTIVTFIEFELM